TQGEVPIMADSGEQATQHVTRVREILPRSASIIEAFRDTTSRDHPGQLVLDTANELAAQHGQQWQAEDVSRASGASADAIAESKRLIDDLNARRVALVERIDEWVSAQVHSRADASLHTETLGSVVDPWRSRGSVRTARSTPTMPAIEPAWLCGSSPSWPTPTTT